MRIPDAVFAAGRYAAGLLVVAGSLLLGGAPKNGYSIYDRARYADPQVIQYVLPGLSFSVVSASIASDGTISVDYKVTDGNGNPLDRLGVQTPGAVSNSFLAAYIPSGQEQFWSFVSRSVTGTAGIKGTAAQATADSGGTITTVAQGEYVYTFKTKAAAQNGGAFDSTATTRIGIYGSRNLTAFDLGTSYASTTFDFVPNGGKVAATRDVIRTASCNQCHEQLAFHGGSRRGMDLCIMCHTPQTADPDTGNTMDMKVLAHKIHMGSELPSVQSGKPYQVIGFQNSVSDWSTVEMPSDPRRCAFCHQPQSVAGATQSNAWLTKPTRAACGACHDNVNFASGVNHVGGPQPDDAQCAQCHTPQGELEFDASIIGAHTVPDESVTLPGINFKLVSVANAAPGKQPAVNFTVTDNQGKGIPMSSFSSISMTMSGPTTDYGNTSFGAGTSNTPGYVTEAISGASCSSAGACLYTFTHAIPANATGTYAIGIEGRISTTLYPGTTVAQTVNAAGHNQVIYFSVDGSPVSPRRTVVAEANCNGCHSNLELHGNLRNDVAYCVLCHNPSNTDFTTRPSATVAAYQSLAPQAINFALMVHKIHTGAQMPEQFGTNYIVIGFRGAVLDFGKAFASVPASIPNTGVRYPVMGPTGGVADTAKCAMCHVNTSEASFPEGLNAVTDPQGLINPVAATTSACTACHQNRSAAAHALSQTDPKLGESCDVCHGTGAAFDVDAVHAGK
jgi:OmcA/MtrC family decaheme c-type cytochrome